MVCKRENKGLNDLVTTIARSRNQSTLTAAIRVFLLTYFQAAATDDAIIISLGPHHSFALGDVFHYLNSGSARDLLVQALLDAPVFQSRWRWNATRALAVLRARGGRKVPTPLQRMEAEDLSAAVFPDQLACPENLVGDREIPDHPLIKQTIQDCLTEAMDCPGLIEILQGIEAGKFTLVARDTPEPSPLTMTSTGKSPGSTFCQNSGVVD